MGTLILIKCNFLTHIKWPCTCEPKGINRFSLWQNLGLLLTLFESKPHNIIIFHFKINRKKLENHHVNGSQTRIIFLPEFRQIFILHHLNVSYVSLSLSLSLSLSVIVNCENDAPLTVLRRSDTSLYFLLRRLITMTSMILT